MYEKCKHVQELQERIYYIFAIVYVLDAGVFLRYYGAELCNSLPDSIRDSEFCSYFRTNLEKYLLETYRN